MPEPFINREAIKQIEDFVIAPHYDIHGSAEEFMREWAKYEGKLELLTKLKKMEK